MSDPKQVFRDLANLAETYIYHEREVQMLEEQLKRAKSRFREVREEGLPDLMSELHQQTITVPSTGERIEVSDEVWIARGITRDPEVHAWLDGTGNGALIRRQVVVEFEKSQQEEARGLLEQLRASGFPYAKEEGVVHFQSLLKTVKDRLAEGEDVPEGLLGVVVRQVAKIIRK